MDDANQFLTVLSKIMQAEYVPDPGYDYFYELINNKLTTALNNSHYPNAPKIISSLNELYDRMETFHLFQEFYRKAVFEIDGIHINNVLKALRSLFKNDIASLYQIKTNVPYVILPSEEFAIQAVNFNNSTIDLTLEELKILIEGCSRQNMDILRLVYFVKLYLPLHPKNICYIINDMAGYKTTTLRPFCTQRLFCNTGSAKEKLSQNWERHYQAVIQTKTALKLKTSLTSISQYDLSSYLLEQAGQVFYGFYLNFHENFSAVQFFYNQRIKQLNQNYKALTNDIVRLGKEHQKDLTPLQKSQNQEKDILKQELEALNSIFRELEDTLANILNTAAADHPDESQLKKLYPENTALPVLNEMFYAVSCEEWEQADECVNTLQKIQYPYYNMASVYIQSAKKHQYTDISSYSCNSWSEAKMMIGMMDISKATPKLMEKLIVTLHGKLDTGKELYLQALVYQNQNNEEQYLLYLKKSFHQQYKPAGKRLLELYHAGCSKISLNSLIIGLIPEACMEKIRSFNTKDNYEKNMLYLKIAASQEYIPAIEAIADTVYQVHFSNAQTAKDEQVKEEGHQLCILCDYLISKRRKPMHYQEMKGVVLFSLKENLTAVMQLLSGINTPISNYCKGVLYYRGDGTAQDYKEALIHFQNANNFKNTAYYIDKIQEKFEQEQKEEEEKYQAEKSYTSSSSNYSYSSSGCFITTAACSALQKGDDCEELNILRRFRDQYLNSTLEGEELVLEYYRVGPQIVRKLDSLPDSKAEYQKLWQNYIQPSYQKIHEENWEEAKAVYVEMVRMLCKRFDIAVRTDIAEKYDI